MLAAVLNKLFKCRHPRKTFPMTPTRGPARGTGTTRGVGAYVVCLDCGQEFAYNWGEMRVGHAISVSSVHGSSPFSNPLVAQEYSKY